MKRALPYLSLVLSCIFFIASLGGASTAVQLQQSGGSGSSVTVTGALPTGGNTIGGVNIVSALPTGANTIGAISNSSFGISGAIPTGANSIGTVGLNTGSNAIGSITNTGFNVTGSLPTGANAIGTVAINAAIPAGGNLIGSVKMIPTTGCGATYVDSGMISVPSSSTLVTSFTATSCVEKIFVSNITASPVTFSLTDNTATPLAYVTNFSIPGNSNLLLDFEGIKFNLGVKWSAGSAAALQAQAIGYQ